MSAIYVYTCGEDLFMLLSRIESLHEIKYVRAGEITGPSVEEYESYSTIPNLGRATGIRSRRSGSYLIVERNYDARVETTKMFDGNLCFDVEQPQNPESILFCPGGELGERTIIMGDFSTISNTEVSLKLFRTVRSEIRKDFTKIKRYWLGPEALLAFRNGWRLTHAADTSSIYDLREI
jgi:hypothetical protein